MNKKNKIAELKRLARQPEATITDEDKKFLEANGIDYKNRVQVFYNKPDAFITKLDSILEKIHPENSQVINFVDGNKEISN